MVVVVVVAVVVAVVVVVVVVEVVANKSWVKVVRGGVASPPKIRIRLQNFGNETAWKKC